MKRIRTTTSISAGSPACPSCRAADVVRGTDRSLQPDGGRGRDKITDRVLSSGKSGRSQWLDRERRWMRERTNSSARIHSAPGSVLICNFWTARLSFGVFWAEIGRVEHVQDARLATADKQACICDQHRTGARKVESPVVERQPLKAVGRKSESTSSKPSNGPASRHSVLEERDARLRCAAMRLRSHTAGVRRKLAVV